jgi:SET domain-containing protein
VIDVEVKPSPIQGLGVFASRRVAAGQRIRRVKIVREVTPASPIREDAGERIEHCGYPDGKILLWDFPDRHVNHSCDPNAYELYEEDAIHIVARREIEAGDEITFDYNINTAGGNSWPCHCGAPRCRGESIGDFFSLPEEQQREYLPYLAEWFVRRHRDRLESFDASR